MTPCDPMTMAEVLEAARALVLASGPIDPPPPPPLSDYEYEQLRVTDAEADEMAVQSATEGVLLLSAWCGLYPQVAGGNPAKRRAFAAIAAFAATRGQVDDPDTAEKIVQVSGFDCELINDGREAVLLAGFDSDHFFEEITWSPHYPATRIEVLQTLDLIRPDLVSVFLDRNRRFGLHDPFVRLHDPNPNGGQEA
jgi:hypothetical protein